MHGKSIQSGLIVVLLVVLGVCIGRLSATGLLMAGGTLDSPGPPSLTSWYTLEDIYNRLNTGAAGTQTTFTEPTSGPLTGTMHTLNDIMALAPQLDSARGASQTQVLTGKTFWGLTSGQWGPVTGSMPDKGAVTIAPTTTDQAIAAGYHNGSGYVVGDADLAPSNIKNGVNLFGVNGSVIEATGNANAGDVLIGKSFSKLGQADIAGTMANNGAVVITPTMTDQAIAEGYHNGLGRVSGDANLISGNIRSGVTLFGVTGIYPVAPVPKTGQTISYTVGDDGDLEKGVAWPIPRFITSTAGIVTDTLTGLIWLQNANCFGLSTLAQALSNANGLASGSCGLLDGSVAGDWRLPNLRELQSLVDYGRHSPALPSGHPFTGVQLSWYWSGTSHARITSFYAWGVNLTDGDVYWGDPATTHYVWPVRGGQ